MKVRELIEHLEAADPNGDVYFDVEGYEEYGSVGSVEVDGSDVTISITEDEAEDEED